MSNRRRVYLVLGLPLAVIVGVAAFRWWTRPPALEFDNLKYIQLLTTAVSSRNAEWLGKVELAVNQQHQSGQMSDAELASLHEIIGIAEAGDWSTADVACYELAVAQLGRHRERPPSASHDHEHH